MAEEVLVTRRAFLILLVIGMLASSGISIVASTQLLTGLQGPKGDKGDTGPQGETGHQGPQREQGPEGPQGPAGVCALGWLPAPAYDSGWVPVPIGTWMVFNHGLNTTEELVYVVRNDSSNGIGHYQYGDWFRWIHLSENEIIVSSRTDNPPASIRVQIWKISEPD